MVLMWKERHDDYYDDYRDRGVDGVWLWREMGTLKIIYGDENVRGEF